MKRKFFILLLAAAICFFGFQTISLFNDIKNDALEETQKTNVNILKMIEDSISLCSVAYNYEDYITRKKTWVLGLNPSIKYAKFIGEIKVGCEIKSVIKETNKFFIVLSEPFIVEHELYREGSWEGKEGTWNNFSPAEEGQFTNEQKNIVENRLIEELKQEDKKRNNELIEDLLAKFGAKKASFSIIYVKK